MESQLESQTPNRWKTLVIKYDTVSPQIPKWRQWEGGMVTHSRGIQGWLWGF